MAGDSSAQAASADSELLERLAVWRQIFDSSAFASAHPLVQHSLSTNFVQFIVASAIGQTASELARLRLTCRDFADTCYPLSPARRKVLEAVNRCDQELFATTRQRSAIDAAISTAVLVLNESSRVATDVAEQQYNLANLILQRYEAFGDAEDLDARIQILTEIAVGRDASFAPGERETYLSALGATLRERYGRTGDEDDFERAVVALDAAARATQTAGSLIEVGMAYLFRYERTGDTGAFDRAQQFFMWAQQLSASGSEDHLEALNDLGAILTTSYQRTAVDEDLDRAIACHESGLALGPSSSLHFIRNKANLARALVERYRRDGAVDDVTRAVSLAEQAVRAWPSTPGPPEHDAVLAGALFHRYLSEGAVADIDRVVAIVDVALSRLPPYFRERGRLESNAGFAYAQRFQDQGALDDLDQAVAHHRVAVGASLRGSPEWGERVLGLAGALRVRADHLGDPGALAEAKDFLEDAVSTLPDEAPVLPRLLASLAALHFSRYELGQDRDGARQAVMLYERAARLTDEAEPVILTNLASALAAVPGRESEDRAVAVAARAVELSRPDSPQLPLRFMHLGYALAQRFASRHRDEDWAAATTAYRQARERGLETNTQTAFDAGCEWGDWAAERGDWAAAKEAYTSATDAADDLFSRQATRGHREFSTGRTTRSFSLLSYALTQTGNDHEAAVALEQGRVRLLAEAFRRSPPELDYLREIGRMDLVDRFEHAARRLDNLQRGEFTSLELGTASTTDGTTAQAVALRKARTEFDSARDAIRGTPGLAAFLGPPSWSDIAQATENSPLVYLSASTAGGHAIVVRKGRARNIPLPDLDLQQLNDRWQIYAEAYSGRAADQRAWRHQLEATTRWLWDAVMGRVLDYLGGEDRAVLIPCGLLGALPLHAAWTPDNTTTTGRLYAMDRILLTYAPSALALRSAVRSQPVAGETLLVVDDPRRADLPRLDYATTEVRHVTSRFTKKTVLARSVRKDDVLAALPFAEVLHVVCHGRADIVAPLESALELAVEPLRLADIMSAGPLDTRLVALSACETASVGITLPDESTSFPTGLLQAGTRAVVGAMWAIPDRSAMMLMARFYELWRSGERSPAEALREAQRWVRDSTNAEKQAALGESTQPAPASAAAARLWLTARDTVDPVHWAGFTYHGR